MVPGGKDHKVSHFLESWTVHPTFSNR
jgi:hypothetical protein